LSCRLRSSLKFRQTQGYWVLSSLSGLRYKGIMGDSQIPFIFVDGGMMSEISNMEEFLERKRRLEEAEAMKVVEAGIKGEPPPEPEVPPTEEEKLLLQFVKHCSELGTANAVEVLKIIRSVTGGNGNAMAMKVLEGLVMEQFTLKMMLLEI